MPDGNDQAQRNTRHFSAQSHRSQFPPESRTPTPTLEPPNQPDANPVETVSRRCTARPVRPRSCSGAHDRTLSFNNLQVDSHGQLPAASPRRKAGCRLASDRPRKVKCRSLDAATLTVAPGTPPAPDVPLDFAPLRHPRTHTSSTTSLVLRLKFEQPIEATRRSLHRPHTTSANPSQARLRPSALARRSWPHVSS